MNMQIDIDSIFMCRQFWHLFVWKYLYIPHAVITFLKGPWELPDFSIKTLDPNP